MLKRLLLIISLFLSFLSNSQTLYWVGGSGYWNDIHHWSFTSGGTPAGVTPSANADVVFDNESGSNDFTIHALMSIHVKSINSQNNFFTVNVIGSPNVDLKLTDNSDLNEHFFFKLSGKIYLEPIKSSRFNFSQNKFQNDIYVKTNSKIDLRHLETTKSLNFTGNVSLEYSTIIANNLVIDNSIFDFNKTLIQIVNNITVTNSSFKNQTGSIHKIICNHDVVSKDVLSRLQSIPNISLKKLMPQACNPTLIGFTRPTCAGVCDGTATFNLAGCSNPPYSTTWLPDPTTPCAVYPPADFGVVGPTYTVTNICGCGTDFTVLFENNIGEQGIVTISGLTNPTGTFLTFTTTQPSCNGLCDGQVRLNVLSGTLPLTINWNPPVVTHSNVTTRDTLKNACAGTYTITATNNNGCVNTFTTILAQPTVLIPNGTSNSITCNGSCNGSANVAPSGGNGGYTYTWSPGNPIGQSTSSVSSLCPGVYSVSIKDSKGCPATYSTTITQPPAITLTINKTNLICGNICDGTASVTATGGSGPFTYTLQTPVGASVTTNPPYSALCAGTYTLNALNNGNCIKTQTFTITGPPTLTATPTQTNILCNAVCNASINLNPSGGTGALTYTWSPSVVPSSSVANNVCAGVYSYTITDNVGCKFTNSVTITQPPAITLTVNKTDVKCNSAANGSATAVASGGNGGYTYTWSPGNPTGQGTASVTNLAPGNYSVNITDANGCTKTQTFSITQPPTLSVNSTSTSPTCNGACNGSITAAPVGGNGAPFTFTLQSSVSASLTSNPPYTALCAGSYTLIVSDALGCTKTTTINLVQPNPITLSLSATPINCFNQCNSTISSVINGGTPTYTVTWNTGGSGGSQSNQCAGVHTATVTDSKGCQANASVNIVAPTDMTVSLTATQPNCNAQCTGIASANISGGTPNYTVTWNNGTNGTNNPNLCQGTYTATVKDFLGCIKTQTISIITPPALILSTTNGTTSCFGACDGSVSVTASGGTAGYTYNWNSVPSQTTATATGLCLGNYNVSVTDSKGCLSNSVAAVAQPTLLTASINNVQPSCNVCIGSATGHGAGGNPPYSYSWAPGGQITQTANNLCVGIQTLTITDSKNCTATQTVQIIQAINIIITSNSNTLTCNNACSGVATANPSGGTGPGTYSFTWTPAPIQNTQTATNLCAGSYTVDVKDANGCSNSNVVNFVNPPAITLTVNQSNVTCNGACNGTASVTASGGKGAFTYNWQPGGATTPSIGGLCPGDYTVTATDGNSCTQTQIVTITEASSLTATFSFTTPSTCTANDGAISVIPGGGTAPYTFTWVPGGSVNPLINLSDGSYILNLTDANGCIQSFTTSLSDPVGPTVTVTSNSIACFGTCTGSATLSITAATPSFTVNWPTIPSTNTVVANLCVGSYVAQVTDDNLCITNQTVNITQPTQITSSGITTNVTCNAVCTGSINLTPSGGTGGYTYSWSPSGGAVQDPTNLCARNYSVDITDANSCLVTNTFVITEPPALTLSFNKKDVLCNGGCTGSVRAVVGGGSIPYTYSWTPVAPFVGSALDTIINLCTGVYSVTATDANGCTITGTVNIGEPTALTLTVTPVDTKCSGQCNGSASTLPSGGTAPYGFSYNTTPATPTSTVNGLCAGSYTSTVSDANGCINTSSFVINSPLPITITSTVTNPKCNAACDGSVATTVTGGNPNYNYAWSPTGNPVANPTGLCAGIYTVTVTDDSLCTGQAIVTLVNPTSLIANASFTNPTCAGGCDGIATVTPIGGTGAMTFSWTPANVTTQTANALCAGTQTVTVTDANSCQAVQIINVTSPVAIAINAAVTPATCGSSNGSIDASAVVGGLAPYTYSWSPNVGAQTTNTTVTNIPAGVYTVVVTDASACTSSVVIPLSNSNGPTGATMSTTVVSCQGRCDGAADISNPLGGTSPYTLSWINPVFAGTTVTNLCVGTYTAQIADANNCLLFMPVTITEPQAIDDNETITPATCFGICNGAIALNPTGGNGGYTYSWTPAANTASVNNLCPGAYTATITDSKGCTLVSNYLLPSLISITANTIVTNNSCFGKCNGTALVTNVAGGTPNYSYSWSDPLGQSTSQATGLCSGAFSVTITDANGCFNQIPVLITSPSQVTFTSNITQPSCGQCDGAVSITPSGGNPNYSYIWSLNNLTTNSLSNLCAGLYMVQITDANGCQTNTNVVINNSSTITGETITKADVSCAGVCDGSISITAIGGVPAISYTWLHNGSNSQTLTNLCPGTYFCNMVDANGCIRTASVVINATTDLTITPQVTQSSCAASNGAITTTVTGGSGIYTYAWLPASVVSTTNSAVNLAPGSYTLTVSDGSCSKSQIFSINSVNGPLITFTQKDISCGGTCDGNIDLTISGGTPAYTTLWSNGASTNSISALCAGAYSVQVTDGAGCVAVQNFSLTTKAPLVFSLPDLNNPVCNNNCNGSITALPNGGTLPYTYSWTPNAAASTSATSLCSGNYTLTVTDVNGCTITDDYTLTGPPAMTLTAVVADATCNAVANGTIDITVTGGVPIPVTGYTYSWTPIGAITEDLNGILAGTYSITVTDNNGCNLDSNFVITQPAAIDDHEVFTPSACFGNCNGAIDLTPTGGTGPYTYSWSPGGATTGTVTNLCPGPYTATITDIQGCTLVANYNLPSLTTITANTLAIDNTCFSSCNGVLTATNVAGGAAPYTLQWNDPLGQAGNTAINLCNGTYSVTITDANGCFNKIPATVSSPSAVTFTPTITDPTCGQCDGSATINPSGGTPTYSLVWSNAQSGTSITNLCAGVYQVQITDLNGCQTNSNVIINSSSTITGENIVQADVSCSGVCDGSVTVTAIGGNGAISYHWVHNNSVSQSLTNLCPGTYFCNMTDATGCTRTASVTINATTDLTVTPAVTQSSCTANTGAVTVTVSGGSGVYTYAWLPGTVGSITNTASNLAPGNYTLTVSDGSCSKTQIFSINSLNGPSIAFIKKDLSCNGVCDGNIALTITGGTPGYTTLWSTGSSSTTITGLCAGSYSVDVTDLNGCKAIQNFSISSLPSLAFSLPDINSPLCHNNCNGSITSIPSGGTLPYTFSWTPNSSAAPTASTLCSGNYSVTITDANGCFATEGYTLTNPTPIVLTATSVPSSCSTVPDASIDITVSGGTPGVAPAYSYSWTPGGATTEDLNPTLSGNYTVSITDANGCREDSALVIGTNVLVDAIAGNDTTFCQNGTLTLDGSQSVGGDSYQWTQIPGGAVISNTLITSVTPAAGTSTFVLIATTIVGCNDRDTIVVTANALPTVDAGPMISIPLLGSGQIGGNPTSTTATSYSWTPNIALDNPTGTNPTSSTTVTTVYTITIVDANGCTNFDTVTVFVYPEIKIPNGFSPNADGKNDTWMIDFIQQFPDCTVEVYNRWGEQLFYSKGYPIPWNGQYKGKNLPVGTYYYVINLNHPNYPKPYTGPLTIFR